jgi:hypothetical protein
MDSDPRGTLASALDEMGFPKGAFDGDVKVKVLRDSASEMNVILPAEVNAELAESEIGRVAGGQDAAHVLTKGCLAEHEVLDAATVSSAGTASTLGCFPSCLGSAGSASTAGSK